MRTEPLHILHIEDDMWVIRSMETMMPLNGIVVTNVITVEAAFKWLKKPGNKVDAIVTDIILSGGEFDGVDGAHLLQYSYPSLPIIALTGLAHDDRVRSGPFKAVFSKPLKAKLLADKIREVCGVG